MPAFTRARVIRLLLVLSAGTVLEREATPGTEKLELKIALMV